MADSRLPMVGLPATAVASTACRATACRARTLTLDQRGELALGVLMGSRSAAQAAREEGVSRKFVGAQVEIARQAVQHGFDPDFADVRARADERVLFRLPITGRLIQRLGLGLFLGCHSCDSGVLEQLWVVLGITKSLGTIHNLVIAAALSARRINEQADLSSV